jgi:hypothetical protein
MIEWYEWVALGIFLLFFLGCIAKWLSIGEENDAVAEKGEEK